jgi:hypothetical protein
MAAPREPPPRAPAATTQSAGCGPVLQSWSCRLSVNAPCAPVPYAATGAV